MFNLERSTEELREIVVTASIKKSNHAKISKFSSLKGSPQENS